MECKINIAGTDYGEGVLVKMSTHRALFKDKPAVGCCISGTIELDLMLASSAVPRRAVLKPYIREDGDSAWTQKGRFYTRFRSVDKETDLLTIEGFDAMLMCEQAFTTSGDQSEWPMKDRAVVDEICRRIETTLAADTAALLVAQYDVQYPGYGDDAYTIREVLGFIGAMYGGNWIIDNAGELRLIPLTALPAESSYLITESGRHITFGEAKILV